MDDEGVLSSAVKKDVWDFEAEGRIWRFSCFGNDEKKKKEKERGKFLFLFLIDYGGWVWVEMI